MIVVLVSPHRGANYGTVFERDVVMLPTIHRRAVLVLAVPLLLSASLLSNSPAYEGLGGGPPWGEPPA